MLSHFLAILFVIVTYCGDGALGTKCFRDEGTGDRKGNVYYCDDTDKPECCEQDQEFTCCQTQSSKTLKEQFILWGAVLAAVILITVLVCWMCKDNNCCSSEKTVKERCCCSKRQEMEVTKPDEKKGEPYKLSPLSRNLPPDEDLKIYPGTTARQAYLYY